MKYFLNIIFLSLVLVFATKSAYAVPPPDFLFNVGSQIVQVFSILVVFFSAFALSAWQFLKVYFRNIKHKKLFWISAGLIVVLISFGAAYGYQQYQQQKAYEEWVSQSSAANEAVQNINNNSVPPAADRQKAISTTQTASQEIPSPNDDKYIFFIKKYYSDLENGKLEEAYNVSKKSVSFDVYKSWYENLQSIKITNLQAIDTKKYSLQLTLNENTSSQNYAVLMTLNEDFVGNITIGESAVRALSDASSPLSTESKPAQMATNNPDFFNNNKALPLTISNTDFQTILKNKNDLYVLDAREDEEVEIGNFPNSNHVRFADLMAGEWIRLPTDKLVYVFCWSGIRGKEVAEFLRSKKIAARYVEKGADGWVQAGGMWNGEIKFSSKYKEEKYQRIFNTDEIKKQIAAGIVMVDSRQPSKFDQHHIEGSINIPMIYTPSSKIDSVLAQVPEGKSIITVCDDFVSCFDAKVTGIKLEKNGHIFLGRYNKPWEYQN